MNRLPFKLAPAAKDYLWGGTRLNDDFGKNLTVSPLAETWECSTHSDGLSLAMIPNGVTSIANRAFEGGTGLNSISFPSSLQSIGYRAFYQCTGLASVKIPVVNVRSLLPLSMVSQ